MFCASLALFGTIFLGFLGYLIQIQMPFLKFKMHDRETTKDALYTSSIIYFVLFLIILLYDCCKTKPYPHYKVYQQWKYEILSITKFDKFFKHSEKQKSRILSQYFLIIQNIQKYLLQYQQQYQFN